MSIIEDLKIQNEILKQEIQNLERHIENSEDKNRIIYRLLNKQNTLEENERIIIALKNYL